MSGQMNKRQLPDEPICGMGLKQKIRQASGRIFVGFQEDFRKYRIK